MALKKVLVTAAVALMLTLPLSPALASHGKWSGFSQTAEPNSRWDTPAYIWGAPNQEGKEKIYFNGLMVRFGYPAWRHDFQAADGNVVGPEGYFFAGVLGFWRDCNKDGYIGARNVPGSWGNFAVYPREGQTIDESICPSGTPYNPKNSVTGAENELIDEFRWIGPCNVPGDCPGNPAPVSRTCIPPNQNPPTNTGICTTGITPTNDANDVTDNASRMWVDFGFPGSRHIPEQGIVFTPPGTYSDSEGTLGYVDDAFSRDISRTIGAPWHAKPKIGRCDDPRVFLGGPENQCGLWPLYQAKRLVNDGDPGKGEGSNGQSFATLFDTKEDSDGNGNPCDDFVNETLIVQNPASSTGETRLLTLRLPDLAPSPNPNILVQGSVAGTLGHVQSATNGTAVSGTGGKCGSGANGTGQLETAETSAEFTHRTPTQNLNWTSDQRYHMLDAFGFEAMPLDVLGARAGPASFGPLGGSPGPGWFSHNPYTPRPPRHGWGATVPAYATYYADVTAQTFAENGFGATPATALPSGGQDKFAYGVPDYCPAVTTGPSNVNPANDWECSVDVWKAKRDFDAKTDNFAVGRPVIGDAYDLRDVDCYDNTVSESLAPGVHVGVADCGLDHA